jgi:hypothetical protein
MNGNRAMLGILLSGSFGDAEELVHLFEGQACRKRKKGRLV